MELLQRSPSGLELTMAVPGLSPSSDHVGCCNIRDLDINQPPATDEDEYDEEGSAVRCGSDGGARKKLRLTKEQSLLLEESFRENQTLNPKQKEALASKLQLRPRQVEVWFQNRRARTKLKQTEMECEYLKRWYGTLTEENRRLQREVEELRSLRVAPPTVISPHTCQPLPASSLTMCPRCERISTSNNYSGHYNYYNNNSGGGGDDKRKGGNGGGGGGGLGFFRTPQTC
ncbi:Homeobox-leucine zipper protein HOX3 [Acorus gramineus]|uniref:Homeobox-leucine zipper protein HOX3 n=1 Tax=Acorus gramineus TaxID=55184 RepID=A0AAV9AY36_ACOGR|nr:Homeobox-leucine zipper protein HOX3 [Acorus gramineus]